MSIANHCFVLDACQPNAVASFSHTTCHPAVSDKAAPYVCVGAPLWLIPAAAPHSLQRDLGSRNPLIFRGLAGLTCVFLHGVQGVCLMASSGVLQLAWSPIADAAGCLPVVAC
jgi:hypothetical protein